MCYSLFFVFFESYNIIHGSKCHLQLSPNDFINCPFVLLCQLYQQKNTKHWCCMSKSVVLRKGTVFFNTKKEIDKNNKMGIWYAKCISCHPIFTNLACFLIGKYLMSMDFDIWIPNLLVITFSIDMHNLLPDSRQYTLCYLCYSFSNFILFLLYAFSKLITAFYLLNIHHVNLLTIVFNKINHLISWYPWLPY